MDEVTVKLPVDSSGFLGRQCPSPSCKKFFKVQPTSSTKKSICCPHCGKRGKSDSFTTKAQLDFATEVVKVHILKELEDRFKGIAKIEKSVSTYIPRPPDKPTDTKADCPACGTVFKVNGQPSFCPGCGADL